MHSATARAAAFMHIQSFKPKLLQNDGKFRILTAGLPFETTVLNDMEKDEDFSKPVLDIMSSDLPSIGALHLKKEVQVYAKPSDDAVEVKATSFLVDSTSAHDLLIRITFPVKLQ